MKKTLGEIAKYVKGELVGDADLVITGICGIKEAREGDITFVANQKYFSLTTKTQASAIITPKNMSVAGKSVIRTDNPSLAFANMMALFLEDQVKPPQGIHKTAVIADDAVIGENVSIGPYTVIDAKARIGDDTILYGGCFVGQNTVIGRGCLIYPHVTIRERLSIGNQVIIHSGAVIGSDGFGFVSIDGIQEKIPQVGTVVIEDRVEIGANVTIDRARFDKTFIGQGTKIDNLVQIAHNVSIGKNCIIISQVGISGSVTIGDGVVLAGQAGIAGHLTIGEGAVVPAKSGVSKSIPPNTIVWGIPAKPHAHAKRANAAFQRLPEYVKIIHELKKRVAELESRLPGN
ncbi:MAG: UDP-3-O-(3-hydroxymyristoyl)glucosamine N-acyltransferase [Omnitrophica WOR_2 bacterium RIFCSPHIGHO2_02_FULL_48_11]|nr:MAG: UDP-3-O-(3-hydroxymyristoyl)glucosamine N-acyltransferase [Omnitrophica WOR_2 bacterium RIFCSPHIGHO2_02_FULL_48_11]